jgi:hypothetical protein
MSIVYEINTELGLAIVVCDGVITAADFLAHTNSLACDPGWPTPERRQISDWRSATLDASITQATLEEAAAIYGAHPDKLAGLKVAMLANTVFDQATAFARMVNRYGASVIVFNLPSTACKWLDVPVDQVTSELRRIRTSRRLHAD